MTINSSIKWGLILAGFVIGSQIYGSVDENDPNYDPKPPIGTCYSGNRDDVMRQLFTNFGCLYSKRPRFDLSNWVCSG